MFPIRLILLPIKMVTVVNSGYRSCSILDTRTTGNRWNKQLLCPQTDGCNLPPSAKIKQGEVFNNNKKVHLGEEKKIYQVKIKRQR